jgi:hypothetical protein
VAVFRDTPESDKSSGFGSGLLLYAACAAIAVFVGWPIIKGVFPDSFPAEKGGAPRYDEYGYTGDPGRFDRWRNADQGGLREYSPFFPGLRTQQPQGPGAGFEMARHQRGVEEGGDAASPGSFRRTPETFGSARSPSPQYQQQGQYRQQFRACGGAWWNPFSDAACGASQDGRPPAARGR